MNWYEMVFKVAGWPEDDDFFSEVSKHDGKLITQMSVETPGYWNLTLEDGTQLDAVHTLHIVPSQGVRERSGAW
jgi:hypothetical protein